MKVAAIFGTQQGGLRDKSDPKAKGDIVVVKILAAPMCTEFHGFKDGDQSDCLGHEAVGEVVEVDRSSRVKVGDRVIVQPQNGCGRCYLCQAGDHIHCRNQRDVCAETGSEAGTATMAQYLLKPDYLLTPISNEMSYDHAAMACCGFGPTFGSVELLNIDAFDTVLITGLGPVGLGGVINARYRGARVIGVESHPYRVKLAKELGASDVVNPQDSDAMEQILALTGGIGADKSIETSGTVPAKTFLMEATRRKGRIAFVGWGGAVEVSAIISKGLTLSGVWHYNINSVPRLLKTIAANGDAIDKLLTHRMPMSSVQEAWEVQVKGECGKIILHPWE